MHLQQTAILHYLKPDYKVTTWASLLLAIHFKDWLSTSEPGTANTAHVQEADISPIMSPTLTCGLIVVKKTAFLYYLIMSSSVEFN